MVIILVKCTLAEEANAGQVHGSWNKHPSVKKRSKSPLWLCKVGMRCCKALSKDVACRNSWGSSEITELSEACASSAELFISSATCSYNINWLFTLQTNLHEASSWRLREELVARVLPHDKRTRGEFQMLKITVGLELRHRSDSKLNSFVKRTKRPGIME